MNRRELLQKTGLVLGLSPLAAMTVATPVLDAPVLRRPDPKAADPFPFPGFGVIESHVREDFARGTRIYYRIKTVYVWEDTGHPVPQELQERLRALRQKVETFPTFGELPSVQPQAVSSARTIKKRRFFLKDRVESTL